MATKRVKYPESLDAIDIALARAVDSDDPEYIMRYIRENHLSGASTMIVLCGAGTRWRKYVDWEIRAGLAQQMSLIGVKLPRAGTHKGDSQHRSNVIQALH